MLTFASEIIKKNDSIMSEKQKQVEKERKGVLELLLQKNGLKRKELVDGVSTLGILTTAMGKQPISLNPNHIFVDTNVLIGAYSGDAKFQADSDCLHYLCSVVGKRLYISTLSVAQLISVYQKKKSNEEITRVVRDLQHRFNIINFTSNDIDAALEETGADIEDNIQFVLAKKQKCLIIVTNNYKDYRSFRSVRAIMPSRVRIIPQ